MFVARFLSRLCGKKSSSPETFQLLKNNLRDVDDVNTAADPIGNDEV